MGTRSLTHINDEEGKTLLTFYRQFDGYFSGHGKELAEFLKPFVIVNGFQPGDKRKIANGVGCLAAQIIAHFKNDNEVGGIYIELPGSKDHGEEFVYTVTLEEGVIHIHGESLYSGEFIDARSPQEFLDAITCFEE